MIGEYFRSEEGSHPPPVGAASSLVVNGTIISYHMMPVDGDKTLRFCKVRRATKI